MRAGRRLRVWSGERGEEQMEMNKAKDSPALPGADER